jgi:dienelactone hydrolase
VERTIEQSTLSQGGKEIPVLTIRPESITGNTGLMLVLHGWGGNRHQYREMMLDFSERYNVICMAPEYRDSGWDASKEGTGMRQPYDFSHLQVMDALAAFRAVSLEYPGGNARRAFVWGGSQGGHIAMLATAFAPHTFAVTVDACGIVYPDPAKERWKKAGLSKEDQSEWEIRDARLFVDRIRNKVFLFHGDADEAVDIEQSYKLKDALERAGKEVEAHYTPGGDHFLKPVTTRTEQTIRYASENLGTRSIMGENDFERGSVFTFPCTGRTAQVDFRGDVPELSWIAEETSSTRE